MIMRFNVTYQLISPESAEDGDCAESGFICQDMGLRDAMAALFETRTSHCGGVESIETDEWPVRRPRWISVSNGAEFQTGWQESRSLHLPANITAASAIRVYNLIKGK